MYKAGTHPGIGPYECAGCGRSVWLDNEKETLPKCPQCGRTEYSRLL